ncbi:MAG: transposase [Ktedonobacterales bacterium]|nr:transposase [Ktedonobacterales bacterium]
MIRAQIRLPASLEVAQTLVTPLAPLPLSFSAAPARQQRAATRLRHKWHMAQRAQELHQTGMGLRHLGEALGLAHNTVRTYLQLTEPLSPTPRPLRSSRLDLHEDYMCERWQQGERNVQRRCIATCVGVAIEAVRRWYRPMSPICARRSRVNCRALVVFVHRQAPRALRWFLASPFNRLTWEDLTRRECLMQSSPELATFASLLHMFRKMVRERRHADLRSWMQDAFASGIAELQRFVGGLERDYDAVHMALCFPWSQGITEGKINKIKTLKRSMYGRAGMALLRQRLLVGVA